jgi:multiple sugar transport system permease protein
MASTRRRLALYLLAAAAVVYSLLPVYDLLSVSFMEGSQFVQHFVFPPTPTFVNFLRLLGVLQFEEALQVRQGLGNSVVAALLVMTVTMATAIPSGYALGRLRLRGGTVLLALLIVTRTIPPLSVLLPYYVLFQRIHLLGTIPGLVIVQMSITVPVVTWVLMGFFSALPRDVEMCARLDGCTRWEAFRYALLPLAAPGLAAGAVVSFLFSWNDYLYSLILTSGTPAQTLTAFLSDLGGTVLAAGVVIQIAVAIVLAGFLQKYITSLKIVDPGTVTL